LALALAVTLIRPVFGGTAASGIQGSRTCSPVTGGSRACVPHRRLPSTSDV